MAAEGIGLDIGSVKIKIARVRKRRGSFQIISFGSRQTPKGSVEGGIIKDAESVGETIADLVTELGVRNQTAATAITGPQVYTRIISMPRLNIDELRKAVSYEANAFLPVPAEQTAMDIFPLHEYQDQQGSRVEVFFVAVRRGHLEEIKTACRLGKLKLQTIEIEPLALQRLLPDNVSQQPQAFLNMGASRWCFSVHQQGVPVFNRYFSLAYAGYPDARLPYNGNTALFSASRETDKMIKDLVNKVARSSEFFRMQHQSELKQIFITGGGTRIKGLDKAIAVTARCEVEKENVLARVSLAEQVGHGDLDELKHDFAVAVGLGMRGGDSRWQIKK